MPSQLPIPGIIKKKITELYSFHTVFHGGLNTAKNRNTAVYSLDMTNTKLIAFFQLNDRLHVSECNTQKQKKKKKAYQ
jgi:hypothetical protein